MWHWEVIYNVPVNLFSYCGETVVIVHLDPYAPFALGWVMSLTPTGPVGSKVWCINMLCQLVFALTTLSFLLLFFCPPASTYNPPFSSCQPQIPLFRPLLSPLILKPSHEFVSFSSPPPLPSPSLTPPLLHSLDSFLSDDSIWTCWCKGEQNRNNSRGLSWGLSQTPGWIKQYQHASETPVQ